MMLSNGPVLSVCVCVCPYLMKHGVNMKCPLCHYSHCVQLCCTVECHLSHVIKDLCENECPFWNAFLHLSPLFLTLCAT